jgi:bla regulator protein blaR1
MIAQYFSRIWEFCAPALADHLWQSTLFAISAGMLTLVLRKNRANIRYWLWLAASAKFLLPFSLLISLGSHLAWKNIRVASDSTMYVVIPEVGQPFSQRTPMASALAAHTITTSPIHLFQLLLAGIWFCGVLAVLAVWFVRWRRISKIVRTARPLYEGREVEALRRVEGIAGVRGAIELLKAHASLEPGIFGITRPFLIWPEGISEHLDDGHLEAILAHEVWHVRRRDNLAAGVHMLVEALFWFHPLVWWVGARLVNEREAACDEQVLQLGSEPHVYAESILKTCEFFVGSRLACVSGVTGADLKKRIARIIAQRTARKLDVPRKLLLTAAGIAAVTAPIASGSLTASARAGHKLELINSHAQAASVRVENFSPHTILLSSVSKTLPRKAKKCSKSARAAKTIVLAKSGPGSEP